MKKIFLLSAVLLLAACMPVNASEVALDWKVWPSETDDAGVPHSSLFVVVGDEDVKVGDYAGTFSDMRSAQDGKDVLLHGRYWWAGGGDDITVKRTAKGIDVIHQTVDEESGFGDASVVTSVELPAGAEVTAAAARETY